MGHAYRIKSICSPKMHVQLHGDEIQYLLFGHHPWTIESPTICEKNCHEQRQCKCLHEAILDRVAELGSSLTWFSRHSIPSQLVSNMKPMISTFPDFVAARARTTKCRRRSGDPLVLESFCATGSQNVAQLVSNHAWPTPTRRKTSEGSTHNFGELQL